MVDSSVLAACDLLLEELMREISSVNKAGGAAMATGDLTSTEQALARAKALGAIRQELEGIRDQLKGVVIVEPARPVARATRTRGAAFRVPILRELVSRGGSARAGDVIDAVHDRMTAVLTEYDHSALRTSNRPRWRVTAAWCRNRLREEGLIKSGSPSGLWEITEAGRKWLEENG